jgi:proton-coupled amino acid transporter
MGISISQERDNHDDVAALLEQPLNSGDTSDLLATPEDNEVRRRQRSSMDNTSVPDKEDTMEAYEEEMAEDPHAAGLGGDLLSAVLGMIKGMVGPAILYLPHGFATTGYALALPIMFTATSMYLYSSRCLLEAWKMESSKAEEDTVNLMVPPGSNSSPVAAASSPQHKSRRRRVVLSYPELANRALGPTGETVVKTGIALMQSGVCLTYLIFVPHNLHTSLLYLWNINLSPQIWLGIMVLIEIPLSWITDIRKLTCTNFAANILILYGLMLCLGFAFEEMIHSSDIATNWHANLLESFSTLEPFKSQWFLFVGTSVLLFEGSITLLIPLQESVVLEEERQQFPSVYRRVIICIIVFYIFFGIICWAAFGEDVHTVLTTSLPSGMFATSVQLAYSLAVLMTYPLQNFPALEIATKSIASNMVERVGFKKNSVWIQRHVISSFLVMALAVVAITTMNSLDKVVSLMGSLLGCPIAFVVPPLIHSQLCSDGMSGWRQNTNQAVAIAGMVAMVLASITTIYNW